MLGVQVYTCWLIALFLLKKKIKKITSLLEANYLYFCDIAIL